MKLDRRNFLQLVAGAAGGFLLTPINWKLMDDAAIWTQNWSWVPVPEDGSRAFAQTTCQVCPGGCGLKIRLITSEKNGPRAVKVEGNPTSPINRGGLCAWGAAGLQYLYLEENRVPSPMLRDPKIKAWQAITWDEGLKILAEKIKALSARPEEIALVSGRKRSALTTLLRQFADSLGLSKYYELPDGSDSQLYAARLLLNQDLNYGFDLERARLVLSFGAGLIEGWGSPVRGMQAFNLWRSGDPDKRPRFIQVEPRASLTASKADQWLPAKPGTEAAVALCMAQVMVKEGLFDKSLVAAPGFDKFRALLDKDYQPKDVAGLCGLPAESLLAAAKAFAAASRALALSGQGQGVRPEPVALTYAVLVLNALKGNFHRPGGLYFTPELPDPDLPALTPAGPFEPGIQHLAKAVAKGETKVSLLLLLEANPVFNGPDPAAFQEAFDRIPFKVSFSPFWDESTSQADLILPDHAFLERFDDVETPLGLPYQSLSVLKPIFKPRFKTLAAGDAILKTAKALGGQAAAALPFETYEAFVKARLKKIEGLKQGFVSGDKVPAPAEILAQGPGQGASAEDILKAGVWYNPVLDKPAVKVGFDQGTISNLGRVKALTPAGEAKEFPLTLAVFETLRVASGFHANPPFVTKILDDDFLLKKDSFVNLNPRTAAATGLSEGDAVELTTPAGKAWAKVHLTEGAQPGVVFLPLGLGRSAFDPTLKGKGVNAAALVAPLDDPLSGLPVTFLGRVKITKA